MGSVAVAPVANRLGERRAIRLAPSSRYGPIDDECSDSKGRRLDVSWWISLSSNLNVRAGEHRILAVLFGAAARRIPPKSGSGRSDRISNGKRPCRNPLGRIVASLDRKRLGQATSGRKVMSTEAFSIRRLGGSRWRLRRTRCAMGFERQLAAKSRVGQAPADGKGRVAGVDSAACACRSVRKQWRGNLSPWGRHTNASMCRSTTQEQ